MSFAQDKIRNSFTHMFTKVLLFTDIFQMVAAQEELKKQLDNSPASTGLWFNDQKQLLIGRKTYLSGGKQNSKAEGWLGVPEK